MAETLSARLVRSGLVSRGQLAEALSRASVGEEHLVEALVGLGVAESSLAIFLLGESRARLADAKDLDATDPTLIAKMPAAMAWSLLALPLGREGDGVAVAFADPTDAHAVAEVEGALGVAVVPRVARLGALVAALERTMGPRVARPKTRNRITPEPEPPPVSRGPARATFFRPSDRPLPAHAQREPVRSERKLDSWADLDTPETPPVTLDPVIPSQRAHDTPRRRDPRARSTPPLPDAGPVLAGMRAAGSRDEIVRLACEGAIAVSNMAIFLALKQSVLRGVKGLGGALSDAAVESLVLPASTPSVFRSVLRDGTPHLGALGYGAVDHLFRAATGSRGGNVAIHGVFVSSRCVGLLCADDVQHREAGAERIGVIAHALGHGLANLIARR